MSSFLPVMLGIKRLTPDAVIPAYASSGAACFDLVATSDGDVPPGCANVFDTGLAFEIPTGHVMMVYSRSGHGFKQGIRLSNGTGVIDSDYRGEVKVKLHNDSSSAFRVNKGDRIAQAMIVELPTVKFMELNSLSSTERGTGGFGSTGA
ncbi:TPA: dUTP diphosphatase [Escherichia coli]|nr:dUTP diphosphatase [Escherichia coli]